MAPRAKPSATAWSTFDVAVVGAGVTGSALALGCAQLGLQVALIGSAARRFEPPAAAGAAPTVFDARIYALAPAAVELLSRLSVWTAVNPQRLAAVTRMRVFGDTGNELTFDAYSAAVERLATIVEESELLRVLDAACGFAPNLERRPSALAALQIDEDTARIRLADGAQLTAPLVIGADGAESAVRAAAGISADSRPYDQTALVANFGCERPHDGTAFQWFSDHGVVALLPLPGNAVSLVWSAPDALAEQLGKMEPAELTQQVMERAGHVLGAMNLIGKTASFALRKLTVDRLVAARVALVGDAAHVVHPLAGQGLNLGLQDVAALLEVLQAQRARAGAAAGQARGVDDVRRDLGEFLLLRRYARRRAEPVGLMRVTTDVLARLFERDDPLLRQLRNTGLSLIDAVPAVKRALIRHALG